MKILTFARFGCLAMAAATAAAHADGDMAAALSNCRNEAVSTGLQEEADIKAYIDLCMQAWQMPPGYADPADSAAPDEATSPDEAASPDEAGAETPQAEVSDAAP